MWPFSYSRCATDIVYLRGEAELAGRLLLQRRGAERRVRRAPVRLALNRLDAERNAVQPPGQFAGAQQVDNPGRDLAGLVAWPASVPAVPDRYSRSALRSSPVGAKSRPCATRRPSTATSRAGKDETSSPAAAPALATLVKTASRSQYVAGRNAIRSRSRATISRVATDWTRPADSRGMTFFHRTGETS